jgi:hypothetical protein
MSKTGSEYGYFLNLLGPVPISLGSLCPPYRHGFMIMTNSVKHFLRLGIQFSKVGLKLLRTARQFRMTMCVFLIVIITFIITNTEILHM